MRRTARWLLIVMTLGGWLQVTHAQGGEDVFIEALVDNPTPFIGQQITYIARFYRLQALSNLSFPYTPPDFEGFWRVNIEPFPFTQIAQQIEGRQYIVSEIRTALYPTRSGEIIISPTQITLPEPAFQAGQRLNANPVAVQVRSLPDSAPAGFTGAVGQFEMSATLDRQAAAVGEPVVLRLLVSGTGNIEQLPPPELPVLENWRVFANPGNYTALQQNGRIIGQRMYEWLLVANRPGTQTLPAVNLVYFDPESLTYRTVSTTPVQIEISPGAGALPEASSPAENAVEADRIRPLKAVSSQPMRGSIYPGAAFWLLWLAAPVSAAMSGIWIIHQRRHQQNRVKTRQMEALTRARHRLHKAATQPPEEACRQIETAFWGYFGDKFNLSLRQRRLDELQQIMTARRVPAHISDRVMLCLERTMQGLYAPDDAADVQELVLLSAAALEQLDTAQETA